MHNDGKQASPGIKSRFQRENLWAAVMDDHSMGVVEPAVAVHNLVKTYKTGTAVAGISFALVPGSITGLLGGNGAGKTTTIAMIMGLVLPTSGRIRVLGHPIPAQSAEVLGRMNFESPYVDMPM